MQKIKRVLKKIGAISTGVAFLGATLTGAIAADLADYPSPFISGGAYDDVAIITSSNGMDANSALLVTNAFAGLITVSGGTGTSTTTVAGAYQLDKSGNHFNFDDVAYDIDDKLEENDLPTILADGTFQDIEGTNTGSYTYKQYLLMTNKTGDSVSTKTSALIFDQNKNDPDKIVGDYFLISDTSGLYAYKYQLVFDSAVTLANSADIKYNTLDILGKTYTISSATVTNGNVTKITLLSGDVLQTLTTGDIVEGVELLNVNLDGDKCTIKYDGSTYTIDKGQTLTMNDGILIGVTDVVATSAGSADYCELAIGADKIELEDSKKVKVNELNVDGSDVKFQIGGLTTINVTYIPDDDIYVSAGEEWIDPVFGVFKYMYDGLTEDTEDIKITATGDDVDLEVYNYDGDLIDTTLCYANLSGTGYLALGEDIDNPLVIYDGEVITNNTMGVAGLKDMKGARFLYNFNKRSHIIEITNIDTNANKTTFKVLDTDTIYEDKEFGNLGYDSKAFSVLSPSFTLNFSRASVTDLVEGDMITFTDIHDTDGAGIWTQNEGYLNFSYGNATVRELGYTGESTVLDATSGEKCAFQFREYDTGKETDINLNGVLVNFTYSASNSEININAVKVSNVTEAAYRPFSHQANTLLQLDSDDSTLKGARTIYGTYVEQLTPTSGSGVDEVIIQYPNVATYGNVYIAPVSAESTVITTGTSTSYVALEDTEVTDVTAYNAIVVGGPAANMVAADLLGLDYPSYGTASGLEEGEAIIKLMDNGNKVAMIVYGWEQDDTKRAAKVLESYSAYADDLTGTEVSVTGTSANPTIVGATGGE